MNSHVQEFRKESVSAQSSENMLREAPLPVRSELSPERVAMTVQQIENTSRSLFMGLLKTHPDLMEINSIGLVDASHDGWVQARRFVKEYPERNPLIEAKFTLRPSEVFGADTQVRLVALIQFAAPLPESWNVYTWQDGQPVPRAVPPVSAATELCLEQVTFSIETQKAGQSTFEASRRISLGRSLAERLCGFDLSIAVS